MKTVTVQLLKARDAEESYALERAREAGPQGGDVIRAPEEGKRPAAHHRLASTGFGSDFEPVWTVEIQGTAEVNDREVEWDLVLDRVIEAYRLSDPVITNLDWPQRTTSA